MVASCLFFIVKTQLLPVGRPYSRSEPIIQTNYHEYPKQMN